MGYDAKRIVTNRDDKGHPVVPIVDLKHSFDGTLSRNQLLQIIQESGYKKRPFWRRYLAERVNCVTFRMWYSPSYSDRVVPDWVLLFLTARHPELYDIFKHKVL